MNLLSHDILVEELAIAALPEDAQRDIINDVEQNVLMYVLLAILATLPPDKQKDFKHYYLDGREAEAENVAKAFIPDYDTFVAQESRNALMELRTLLENI